MRSDPRCPACNGKVSATAEWCMHCGADFDRPPGETASPVAAAIQGSAGHGHGSDDDLPAHRGLARALGRAVGRLDEDGDPPRWLTVGVALVGWYLVIVVGPAVSAGLSFLATVGLYVYLQDQDAVRDVLVQGAYGIAGLIVALTLVDLLFGSDGGGLLSAFSASTVLAVVFVAWVGWWLDQELPEPGPGQSATR